LQLWKGTFKEIPLADAYSGKPQEKWPLVPLIGKQNNINK
jgi:hypothetical protein